MNVKEQLQQLSNFWCEKIINYETYGISDKKLSEYKGMIYSLRRVSEILGIELDTDFLYKADGF